MLTETIRPREITRYTKPLIWIAAMWDRGKDVPPLTDYLERQLDSFLSSENRKKMSMIYEREMLISRRSAAINARKKVDQERSDVDKSYIEQLKKEINQIEAIYSKREEYARHIIETKKVCYMRYRGGTR